MMQHEGQEEDEEIFDDVSENFVLCALHQAKILRERWKFWSGSVPAYVNVRLLRLESLLSFKEDNQITDEPQSALSCITMLPLQPVSKFNTSEPFLSGTNNSSTIHEYLTERIEPKNNIIIQGPDIRRDIVKKRRIRFWCCH